MALSDFLSLAVDWLAFDTLADCFCIGLALAVCTIARNLFRRTQ